MKKPASESDFGKKEAPALSKFDDEIDLLFNGKPEAKKKISDSYRPPINFPATASSQPIELQEVKQSKRSLKKEQSTKMEYLYGLHVVEAVLTQKHRKATNLYLASNYHSIFLTRRTNRKGDQNNSTSAGNESKNQLRP